MSITNNLEMKVGALKYTVSRLKQLGKDAFSEIKACFTSYTRAWSRSAEEGLYAIIASKPGQWHPDGYQFFMSLISFVAEVNFVRPKKTLHKDTVSKFKNFLHRYRWFSSDSPTFFYLYGRPWMVTIRKPSKAIEIRLTEIRKDDSRWNVQKGVIVNISGEKMSVRRFTGGGTGQDNIPSQIPNRLMESDIVQIMVNKKSLVRNLFYGKE